MNEEQKIPELNNTPISPNGEIDHDKLWAVVAYFIFFLPIIFVPNRSAFLNFHINQGIILLVVSLAGYFGFDILPFGISILIGWLWRIAILALLVAGVMNVLKKEMKPLPIIGKLFTFLK